MAFHYKRGKRFYWGYKDDAGKWKQSPMRQDGGKLVLTGGRPVLDSKVATYLINEYENALIKGQSPIKYDSTRRINDVIPEYVEFIRGTISPKQFHEEQFHLRIFSLFLNNSPLVCISLTDVKSYIYSRTKSVRGEISDVSDRTKNSYLITLKKFFKFCIRKEYLTQSPAHAIPTRKLPKNIPTWLENGTDLVFIETAKNSYPEYYQPIVVGNYNGLRIRELIYLQWTDIIWSSKSSTGVLSIQNKANFKTKNLEYRRIPLSKVAEAVLRPVARKSGYCFWPDDPRRFSYEYHRKIFRKIAKDAKIELPPYKAWHIIRHTFATKHARDGRSELKLAKWLGHNSLEMVKRYSHLDDADKEIDNVK